MAAQMTDGNPNDALGPDGKPTVIPLETYKESAPSAYPLMWDGEASVETKVPELIDDLLPQIGVALLAGQWGLFKTFTALDLALSVMTMTPFAGRNTLRQGGVLFIAAEGAKYIPSRLLGVKQAKAPDRAPEGAALMSKERMPFARIKSCPKLTDDDALPTLIAIAKAAAAELKRRFNLPLALIEIDAMTSAANFKDADDTAENQRVMTTLNKLAETMEALVLVVDHFGKDPTTGTRNSSAKEGGVDAVLALIGDRTMAGTVSNTRLAIRKSRGGETGVEIPFRHRLIELEDGGGTLVIDWSEAESEPQDQKPKSVPQSLAIFMKALDFALCNAGGEICPFNDKLTVRAVKRDFVRHEFNKTYPAENKKAKEKAFMRCGKSAVASGVIASRELGTPDGEQMYYWRQTAK